MKPGDDGSVGWFIASDDTVYLTIDRPRQQEFDAGFLAVFAAADDATLTRKYEREVVR
jgi:hypothetical protein